MNLGLDSWKVFDEFGDDGSDVFLCYTGCALCSTGNEVSIVGKGGALVKQGFVKLERDYLQTN